MTHFSVTIWILIFISKSVVPFVGLNATYYIFLFSQFALLTNHSLISQTAHVLGEQDPGRAPASAEGSNRPQWLGCHVQRRAQIAG